MSYPINESGRFMTSKPCNWILQRDINLECRAGEDGIKLVEEFGSLSPDVCTKFCVKLTLTQCHVGAGWRVIRHTWSHWNEGKMFCHFGSHISGLFPSKHPRQALNDFKMTECHTFSCSDCVLARGQNDHLELAHCISPVMDFECGYCFVFWMRFIFLSTQNGSQRPKYAIGLLSILQICEMVSVNCGANLHRTTAGP